jgi:hypothetical protein
MFSKKAYTECRRARPRRGMAGLDVVLAGADSPGASDPEAVDLQGSLAEETRRIGWSYGHTWSYDRRADSVLGVALVLTEPSEGPARGSGHHVLRVIAARGATVLVLASSNRWRTKERTSSRAIGSSRPRR